MKLAVSNIAWPATADEQVAEALAAQGVQGLEVALTKIWPDPRGVTFDQARSYRDLWQRRGFEIVAAQALLFGRPELQLFASAEVRQQTLDYLREIIRVCSWLGATKLVFGSPKNRRHGELPLEVAWPIALDWFARLAEAAEACNVTIVLEPNPTAYGADFVTCAAEAIQLVEAVASPGLGLHLDSACMALAGDDPVASIALGRPWLGHFHASEMHLAPLGSATIDHAVCARALASIEYDGWVSVEMLEPRPFTVAAVAEAAGFTRQAYDVEARTVLHG